MIVIISEDNDNSTNNVIDWLLARGKTHLRINDESILFLNQISTSEKNDTIGDVCINSLDAVWYRRGRILVENPPIKLKDGDFNADLFKQLSLEKEHASSIVHKVLFNRVRTKIGDFHKTFAYNKFEVLLAAKKTGLKVPDTIITSEKKRLIKFANKHRNVITKAISDVASFHLPGEGYVYTYTSLIGCLDEIPETFFPSLFQRCIKKKYELRIFYLHGEFYTMAIFSQNDEKTKVDFRNYNKIKPNRNVPFALPRKIAKKLKILMQLLGFDTGSIDMLVDINNEYYFLEINPVGQYDMVSCPCNYNLHKKIADKLSE